MQGNLSFPHIGMRNVKTALATTICAIVYLSFGRSPAFACIGAIFGMTSNQKKERNAGIDRFFGTLIGGFLGMGVLALYLQIYPDAGFHVLLVPFMFVSTVILILICQRFYPGGIQSGGVVMCLLMYNISSETFIVYTLSRIFDTGIGALVAIGVNWLLSCEHIDLWKEKFGNFLPSFLQNGTELEGED